MLRRHVLAQQFGQTADKESTLRLGRVGDAKLVDVCLTLGLGQRRDESDAEQVAQRFSTAPGRRILLGGAAHGGRCRRATFSPYRTECRSAERATRAGLQVQGERQLEGSCF